MVAGIGASRNDITEIPLTEPSKPEATIAAATIIDVEGCKSPDGQRLWGYAGTELHRLPGFAKMAVLRLQTIEGTLDLAMTNADAATLGSWLLEHANGR
jgi:hypothetical protein